MTYLNVPLVIISDPICPWCYIGKSRLAKALAERPDHPFQRAWRPFQLNPDMPAEGMDRQEYLELKFGGAEGAQRVYGAIEQTLEDDGLPARLDLIKRTPNTIDAHRVVRWAATVDAQDAVVDALFEKYFVDGQDISDRDLLADIAESAGLERAVTLQMLEDGVELEETRAEDATARQAGVNGVPTFIINNRFVAPGAQPTETWIRVIDELEQAARESASS